MKFQDIFKETGLYVSDSFREGVAFKISRSLIDNSLELSLVDYDLDTKGITYINKEFKIYDRLFDKEYTKID